MGGWATTLASTRWRPRHRRVTPMGDVSRSSTKRLRPLEELLLNETELNRIYLLRNFLADVPPPEAIEFLLGRMRETESNQDFLDSMARGE